MSASLRKRPFAALPQIDAMGQNPPHAPATMSLPFQTRTTAKSVTDLTSEAWYRF
jgi:hypothetical protein